MRILTYANLLALTFGLIGMGMCYVGLHLYNDHKNLHALVNLVTSQQQRDQQGVK